MTLSFTVIACMLALRNAYLSRWEGASARWVPTSARWVPAGTSGYPSCITEVQCSPCARALQAVGLCLGSSQPATPAPLCVRAWWQHVGDCLPGSPCRLPYTLPWPPSHPHDQQPLTHLSVHGPCHQPHLGCSGAGLTACCSLFYAVAAHRTAPAAHLLSLVGRVQPGSGVPALSAATLTRRQGKIVPAPWPST